MGKVFELIADNVLESVDNINQCSFCKESDIAIYDVQGYLIEPGQYMFEDIPLEMEDSERNNSCESCLKQGRIKHCMEWEMGDILKKYCTNPELQLNKYRASPTGIPLLMQYSDWVICCGNLCEYNGTPTTYKESRAIPDTHQFWDQGPQDWKTYYRYGEVLVEPESLNEVLKFRCSDCDKKWFIWQPT